MGHMLGPYTRHNLFAGHVGDETYHLLRCMVLSECVLSDPHEPCKNNIGLCFVSL